MRNILEKPILVFTDIQCTCVYLNTWIKKQHNHLTLWYKRAASYSIKKSFKSQSVCLLSFVFKRQTKPWQFCILASEVFRFITFLIAFETLFYTCTCTSQSKMVVLLLNSCVQIPACISVKIRIGFSRIFLICF